MNVKITNEIQLIEIDGEAYSVGEERRLIVESHWNWNDRVHLKFGDLDLLVVGRDLEKAITNAMNHS